MKTQEVKANDIAVIGMSMKFPGATCAQDFWDNLIHGKESITFYDSPANESISVSKNFVRALPELKGIDLFDASFFNCTSAEASLMDPQNRLFLEAAWEALETTGYYSDNYPGVIGVFAGSNWSSYILRNLRKILDESMAHENEAYYMNLCSNDFLATSVAYKLNLKGPSLGVQTFCTTGLASVHIACQNLILGTCTMALAGGSHVRVPQNGYYYEEGGHDSSDGHSRSFDIDAAGTVPGNGVGVIVLKKLNDAIADRDTIVAVIKGSALVNDGQPVGKLSFNGISVSGQVAAMQKAIDQSKIDPNSVSFIEASGGSTQYVDRVEIDALKKIYGSNNSMKKILVGSVQPNIGHLGHVSGLSSLMKAILSLYHKTYPPTINIRKVNPMLRLDKSALKINTELCSLEGGDRPLTAAVNCFGVGGTYLHMMLQERVNAAREQSGRQNYIITLSAKTASALRAKRLQLKNFILEKQRHINLGDMAYTLNVGRMPMQQRLSIACCDTAELVCHLDNLEAIEAAATKPFLVFLFAGYGLQHQLGRAQQLYNNEKDFRDHFDTCASAIKQKCDVDILNLLSSVNTTKEDLSDPLIGGLIIFAFQSSLAKLLIGWGLKPDAMIGYSAGEFTAAYVGGSLKLNEILELVINKSLLIRKTTKGKMLAVNASEERIKPYLTEHVSFAAQNAPDITILAGSEPDISKLFKLFLADGIACAKLEGDYAFHSPIMGEISAEMENLFARYEFAEPSIPILSDTTVTWLTKETLNNRKYWSDKLAKKVRFHECLLQVASARDNIIFVEVGPMILTVPSASANSMLSSLGHAKWFSCLPLAGSTKDDGRKLAELVGNLWSNGLPFNWTAYYAYESRYRIPLPTYPFERKSFWIDADLLYPGPSPESVSNQNALEHLDGEVERFIGHSWMKLFGLETISLTDNFFQLGGHSLLSTMFFNRARLQYPEVYVTLADLYDNPTIASLAKLINSRRAKVLPPLASHTDQYKTILSDREKYERLRTLIIRILEDELNVRIRDSDLDEPFAGLSNPRVPPRLYQEIRREFEMPVYEYEILRRTTVNELIDFIFREIQTFDQSRSSKQILNNKANINYSSALPVTDAVFIYSSPRSGSTLLRLMLAGHPKLFSPPEIKMLLHDTLPDFYSKSANHVIAHGGVVRSFKELLKLSQPEALDYLKKLVEKNGTFEDVYKIIQSNLNGRILVEKSAELSESVQILSKPEAIFKNPKYIFLIRHPYSVIESIVRNRIYSIQEHHISDPLRFAENEWKTRNQNVLTFCNNIGKERHIIMRYEDLVEDPKREMQRISEFLCIEFDQSLLDPYAGGRMIDGDGDPNIFDHDRLEPELASAWRSIRLPIRLTDETKFLAKFFNYDLPADSFDSATPTDLAEKFVVEKIEEIDQMSDQQVDELFKRIQQGDE